MRRYEDSECSTPPVWNGPHSEQPELFVPRPWECPLRFYTSDEDLGFWVRQRLYNRAASHKDLVTWACRRVLYQHAEFRLYWNAMWDEWEEARQARLRVRAIERMLQIARDKRNKPRTGGG